MARIKRMSWVTVARWLESAAAYAQRFNAQMLKGFVICELQADEIRTFVGAKERVIWVLTTLEVWSRLWVSVVVGRRTPSHARRAEFLEGQVALLMAYYNFLRPHTAVKFGSTVRTPAMQAGLAKKRLSFRDVFTSRAVFLLFVLIAIRLQATAECRQNSTTLP